MQTIGERLEEARKKKGISIREAAEATKIRGDYLQKFETNLFDIGLTEIYTRGFLRTYSNFLKLPADRILNDYAALGRGEVRPRQPSREIYGRMDISVATADAERNAPPAETAETEVAPANRNPQQRSRTGSSLPSGPDPAVIFQYVKWGSVVIIVLLAVLILKSIFGGSKAPATSAANAKAAVGVAARSPMVTVFAVRPVQVKITKVVVLNSERMEGGKIVSVPEKVDGEVLFSGALAAGDSKSVPRAGALFIEGIPAENLDVEVNGRRGNLAGWLPPGYNKAELPAP